MDEPHATRPIEHGELEGLDSLAVELGRRRTRARLLGDEPEPLLVGRFALEGQLGAGGMGSVWLAVDEQLDRRVALKFLRGEHCDPAASARLLREAQGLARISHPNVIPVFEVGEHEGRVWIAMEHVPGRTLREWVEQTQPSAREILDTWIAAGRGLAAVHAAGLIHRDVKPDNLMVGTDGRARVIDFGLVRQAQVRIPRSELDATTVDGASSQPGARPEPVTAGSESLTRAGAFVGTWAYAAPEQRRGEPVDAHADQFGFCVGLVEALTGQRPSSETAALGLEQLPHRLQRVLRRGLDPDPERRHRDMDALLNALVPPPWRRWIVPATLVLVLGLGLTTASRLFGSNAADPVDPASLCADANRSLSASWAAEQRHALAQRFGPEVAERLAEQIDSWATAWSDVAREACERVHVEHLASAASLDANRACLELARHDLDRLLAGLDDPKLSANQLSRWIAELPAPNSCLDADAQAPLSEDERARLEALSDALFRLRYGLDERDLGLRIERSQAVLEQARTTGPAAAEVRAGLTLGALSLLAGDGSAARGQFGAVLDLAEREQLDGARIEAWLWLSDLALDLDLDLERARWSWSRANEALAALPQPNIRHARARRIGSRIALVAGELDEAETLARAALREFAALGPAQAWQRGVSRRNLAQILRARGRKAEAQALLDQAADEDRFGVALGTETVGTDYKEAGVAALVSGRLDEAERELLGALRTVEHVYGARSRQVADVHATLVALYDARGEPDAARHHALLADEITRTVLGPLHFDRTYALSGLGAVAYRERDYAGAERAFALCLRIAEARLAADSPDLAGHQINLGDALTELERGREAEALLRPAITTIEDTVGPDALVLAVAHKALGKLLYLRRDLAGARAELERALEIHALDSEPIPAELGQVHWLLARTLAELGEREAAAREASLALERYTQLGPPAQAEADEIRAWIDTHRTPQGPTP
ncbi:Serine/threonine-protein kinase PK-1 [Enhygromyxa salina]|uniref:Serine/threonine-protein kinase PK-1 n=2 Tax=Enhygromyxa salina TaxID=215803 RepID=A0A2S9YNH5_9BACT|nr:Serine/threonine-protein kinase PK-1 [Enhygromyxa salina]